MANPLIIELYDIVNKAAGITTDSRNPEPGSVFFALKGEKFDGNNFAVQALQKGCSMAVVDDDTLRGADGCFLVDDVLTALQQLGNYHRKHFNIPVVGITGSNGKTTTKELMHRVLAEGFHTNATKGNFNNHIGVPLTLLSYKEPLEIALVEMGANHVGDIAALCNIAEPGFGIITNIGKAHLEGFGSVENIAKGKGELYDFVKAAKGTLFVNSGSHRLMQMATDANTITYGFNQHSHCGGEIIESFPFVRLKFNVLKPFGKAPTATHGQINSQLTGLYNAENILTAVNVGLYFGVEVNAIIKAIESYNPQNNRSQFLETPNNILLMDAYNANPTSMSAALDNFSYFNDKPKAAILGDMLELGDDSDYEHKEIVKKAIEKNFDLLILVGPCFQKAFPGDKKIRSFADVNDASQWLEQNSIKDHRILLKGSRGIHLEKLVNQL